MKRIFITLAALVAVIVFFVVIAEPEEQPTIPAAKIEPEVKKIVPAENKVISKIETAARVEPTNKVDGWEWEAKGYKDDWCHIDELNEEGILQLDKIAREHQQKQGYFFEDTATPPVMLSDLIAVDFEDYRSYDTKTLTALGKEGDLRALNALFAKKEASNDEKYWSGYTAAIFGGTYLPDMLGNKLFTEAFVESLNSNFLADNKSKYVDGLAWSYFSAMRGDFGAWRETMAHFEEFGRVHFPAGTLEGADLELVRQKAHELYQKVMGERKKRNLGEFDKLPAKVATAMASVAMVDDLVTGNAYLWPEEFIPKNNDCFDRVVDWLQAEINVEQ